MEKESNFIYNESAKKEDNRIQQMKDISRYRFNKLHEDWGDNRLDKKAQSEIINKMVNTIVNGLGQYDSNLRPAALQGTFEDMIISGIPSESFIVAEILPKLLNNDKFVEIYNDFGDRRKGAKINEDIRGRIRGAESFRDFYNEEKEDGDFWGTNVSIDALHKIDAVRIHSDGGIDLIQSKSSQNPNESPEDIHKAHQEYIDQFYDFILGKRKEEKEQEIELNKIKDNIMNDLEGDGSQESRRVIMKVYSHIWEGEYKKEDIVNELNKIDLSLDDFLLVHSESVEDSDRRDKIIKFCNDVGLTDDKISTVLERITEDLPTRKQKQRLSIQTSPKTIIEKFKGGINSIVSVGKNRISEKEIKISHPIDIIDN